MRWMISAALCGMILLALPVEAQTPGQGPTTNSSVTIVTGNTFQVILAAGSRRSVTIQNNNATTDNCWLYIGSGSPTKATSILLTPGLPYQRYYPIVPNDAIQATCATAGDTIYIDTQQ